MSSKVIIQCYRAVRLAKDRFKKGSGNGGLGPPHLRLRRYGQDRNGGGPLQRGLPMICFYKEFRLQEIAIPLSATGG